MSQDPVFYDPHGKRRNRFLQVVLGVGVIGAVLAVVFWITLSVAPKLPKIRGYSGDNVGRPSFLASTLDADARQSAFLALKARRALLERQALDAKNPKVVPKGKPTSRVVAGFYATYEEAGYQSLVANGRKLTHLMPEWLHLQPDGTTLDFEDFDLAKNPKNIDVLKTSREYGLQIQPILNNASGGDFDAERVRALLASPEKQQRLAIAVATWLKQQGFQGLNVDFENLHGDDYPRLVPFLKLLHAAFAPANLKISIDLEADKDLPLKDIAEQCDFVVLMAYDQHSGEDPPGPIAGIDWTQEKLDTALKTIDPDKLVMGVGAFAYDWTVGSNAVAKSMSYQEALLNAESEEGKPEDIVDFDSKSLNSNFEYEDEDGKRHKVWFLDAITAFNQWKFIGEDDLRGSAIWVLGQEDPSVWTFMDRDKVDTPPDPKALRTVSYPYLVERDTDRGDILKVKSAPKTGERNIEVDPETGLISDCVYRAFPASYVLSGSGFYKNKLALTFDDGPDAKYSDQILDVLKELHVPATFFLIGANIESAPDVVRRMVADGHEIGSHSYTHPNMGLVSEDRARLEMNATQRAIQSTTGRSTILFRPPYNADSEPEKPEELIPVALAAKMGYVTIGEKIDPNDWRMDEPQPDGSVRHRTAQDLVNEMMTDINKHEGNIILLHDGGGDRSATVQALRILVPQLQKQGYEFVPVSKLMGLTRDQVMPPVTAKERLLVGLDRVVFWAVYASQWFLAIAFVVAIGLGLTRVLLTIPLALTHERKRRLQVFDPLFQPTVSVLIAAFNEEKVIGRTLASILRSEYPLHEVIVIDDGSKDNTAQTVLDLFGSHPKVRVVRQENTGKAGALNHGLELATGEIMFCVDADTQLDEKAVGLAIRHFHEPKIGAVAGNVKVGNRVNWLTRWQSIEYITSQNMDRRAYAELNAVTVVPGAIGAWRKSAVLEAGSYSTDTLAEDMDLTFRIRRAGYVIETENEAIAYTEAPDTVKGFFRQRFRWAYGTLQVLYKHRKAVGRYGWFGRLALPMMWVFQILFQAIAPLVDIQLMYSLVVYGMAAAASHMYTKDWQPIGQASSNVAQVAILYGIFFTVEFGAAIVAYRLDRERLRGVSGLFFQRFVYRQVMYGVIYKSIVTAAQGMRQGWNRVDRKATVSVPEAQVRKPRRKTKSSVSSSDEE